jgi:hypothetical protein
VKIALKTLKKYYQPKKWLIFENQEPLLESELMSLIENAIVKNQNAKRNTANVITLD